MISVIVPIYNVEKYLEKSLDSLINQTYKNLEIILVNDGSTDGSLKICEKYAALDKRIKIINQENGGISAARNSGLDIAKGTYVGFIDGDDTIKEDMFQILYDKLIEYDADISAIDLYKINANNEITEMGHNDEAVTFISDCSKIMHEYFKNNNHICNVTNKLFKKSFIGETRFIYTNIEDRLFSYKIYKKNPRYVHYAIPMYAYYYRDNSASRVPFSQRYFSIIKFTDYLEEDALKIYPEMEKEINEFIFDNILMFLRVLAVSTNKNTYLDDYKKNRLKIIKISKKVSLNHKRKLEVFVLKYCNWMYPKFINALNKR